MISGWIIEQNNASRWNYGAADTGGGPGKRYLALGKQMVFGEGDAGVALGRISRNFHSIAAEIIDELGI